MPGQAGRLSSKGCQLALGANLGRFVARPREQDAQVRSGWLSRGKVGQPQEPATGVVLQDGRRSIFRINDGSQGRRYVAQSTTEPARSSNVPNESNRRSNASRRR